LRIELSDSDGFPLIIGSLKEIAKILLYLVATVLVGALIAPPMFWAGHALGARFGIRVLAQSDFGRYFDRAMLVATLALLWPAAAWLRVRGFSEFGLKPDARWWRHLAFGFAAAMLVMVAMSVFLVQAGIYRMRDELPFARLALVALSAVVVSVLEEMLFRGAILGLVRRTLAPYPAIALVSALYSIVHFIQPPQETVPADAVGFLSGFALLPEVFWQFTQPVLVLSGFTTLFVLGWILGYATIKTRALWLSIGVHASCILGKYGFAKLGKRTMDAMPWFGKDLQTGIGPLIVLSCLGAIVWAWLTFVERGED
jgi:CAAX protease family protein